MSEGRPCDPTSERRAESAGAAARAESAAASAARPESATASAAQVHDQLTPAARGVVDAMREAFGELGPGTDVREQRRVAARSSGVPRPLASVTDRAIPGAAPGTTVRVRVYRPADTPGSRAPTLLFFHGGGWVLCDLDTHDGLCRELAHLTGALVVSVDYRRAPEHPAPAAVQDAYAVLRWAAERIRDEEGGDPGRIAVAGDSAGGALATAACLLAARRGGTLPVAQLLVYPALDPRLATGSMRTYGDPGGYFLTTSDMRWYWGHYLAGAAPTPCTAPSLAADEELRAMPPAYVLTAGCDPLRDEGLAYADRLPCARQRTVPGVFHGFLAFFGLLPEAREALDEAAAWLRERLASRT
ncbi:alpha/beta hydrolase [Streptomyces tubbatahanensis]|uniref:Alpha/beta hydrolase n=1 Tax=Streptomyces tubbatahanensis TaxID=2923272 RepID=A0ABY3XWP2_9ACTN|nr:alpha/beta hydrolase [Streptomyces tubbatahanensis]UNS98926.1 alpha/beta hydrolase [Streptomyces tubbatahanensis]